MIVNLVLITVILIQQLLHYFERRDMYNRLMCKDYAEYKTIDTPPRKHIPSAHSKVLRKWRDKGGVEQ